VKPKFGSTEVGAFDYEFLRGLMAAGWGGAELGECLDVARHIRRNGLRSWTKAWHARARALAEQADAAERDGRRETAAGLLMRASTYMRMACFYASYRKPIHREAWQASRDCFRRSIAISRPDIEVVGIPFGAATLPGYFIRAAAPPRPTLIALGGFDSTAEEICAWIGFASPRYGWNCLVFEGPGQWGAVYDNNGLRLMADYEQPVGAVVDWLLSQDDVRPDQVALIGYSLGGFLAARAAAFEPRIAAVILNPPLADVGEAFQAAWPGVLRDLPPWLFDIAYHLIALHDVQARWALQHARWVLGIERPSELFDAWIPYSLAGTEGHIRCPTLCLITEDEIAQTSTGMIEANLHALEHMPARKRIHLFTRTEGAAAHCQIGGLTIGQATVFDWLNGVFGYAAPVAGLDLPLSFNIALSPVIERHHGPRAAERARQMELRAAVE